MKQRIVLAWEWGAGAGHLAHFVPIVKHFADDESVELVLAARDVTHVRRLFADNTGTLRVGERFAWGQVGERFAWGQTRDSGLTRTASSLHDALFCDDL